MSEEDQPNTIVIDNGSGLIKAGQAGDDTPGVVFPSLVGFPKKKAGLRDSSEKEIYVGEEAQLRRGTLRLDYPLEHGNVGLWEVMERVWRYTFEDKLGVSPEEHPVLLSIPPLAPKANREKMATLMFEIYSVPALSIQNQAVMSLYSEGRLDGLVVESGEGVTAVTPIYEGIDLPHATRRLSIAGRELTDYLMTLLSKDGRHFHTPAQREFVRGMKEELCYVALDYAAEAKKAKDSDEVEKEFEMPDGTTLTLSTERFRCPEPLFQPQLLELDEPGLAEQAARAIAACPAEIRSDMYRNVTLCGGTTLCPGFPERLQKELEKVAPASARV